MLWAFDTEDNSQGKVYWVNFFNGVEHVSFDNSDRAVEWIWNQEGEFWACNLEYDLINLFGPLMDKLLVLTYGGFGLIKSSIYGRKVQFRNTLRHFPLSVEEMGVKLNYKKLPFDPTNLEYCKRDTEVTYFFIKYMFDKYRELGIEEIKATLPSTALAWFVTQWCQAGWMRHPDVELWEFLGRSRYGGRCEIFRNNPVRGYIHEYDINSSYPYAMKSEQYPILESIKPDGGKMRLEKEGAAHCTVHSPNRQFPLLPYKHEQGSKLLFPTGMFSGTWTYPELRKAVELGYTIQKVHRCVEYEAGPSPFDGYITFNYNKRKEVKDTDELMSYTLKLFMNSLFGKWGEEGELTVISRGKKHVMNQIPKHSNMIWASYVLAYGRLNLYKQLMKASAIGEVLYCDTDSVFVKTSSGTPPFPGSKELGELSYKGLHRFGHFKLPKLYQVDAHYKAKGVPLDKRNTFPEHLKREFFEEGIAEFVKPVRWMESKRLKAIPNLWRQVTKQLQSTYDKRVIMTDGKTWPLVINSVFQEKTVGKPGLKRRFETLKNN